MGEDQQRGNCISYANRNHRHLANHCLVYSTIYVNNESACLLFWCYRHLWYFILSREKAKPPARSWSISLQHDSRRQGANCSLLRCDVAQAALELLQSTLCTASPFMLLSSLHGPAFWREDSGRLMGWVIVSYHPYSCSQGGLSNRYLIPYLLHSRLPHSLTCTPNLKILTWGNHVFHNE